MNAFYNEQVAYIERWIENFTSAGGTGAAVDHCIKLCLNVAKYEPLKGSSYIPLPKILTNRKAIINVRNYDDKCLFHAINIAINSVSDHSGRLSKYPDYSSYLKTDGIGFLAPISQIPKVEMNNNLAINVYGYTLSQKMYKVNIFQYHISEQPKEMQRTNLLLISEDVEIVSEDNDDDDEEIIDESMTQMQISLQDH